METERLLATEEMLRAVNNAHRALSPEDWVDDMKHLQCTLDALAPFLARPQGKWGRFSDFIRLASEAEKAELYSVVMERAEARQKAALKESDDLPSRFQLGDVVRVGSQSGMVSGVCFRQGKVFYEVGGVMYASDDVNEPLRAIE